MECELNRKSRYSLILMYSRNLHVTLKEEIEFDPTDVEFFDGGDERER